MAGKIREEQLEHAASYLAKVAEGHPKGLTADEAEDAREARYGLRMGLWRKARWWIWAGELEPKEDLMVKNWCTCSKVCMSLYATQACLGLPYGA